MIAEPPSAARAMPNAGKLRILIVKLSSLGDLFHALPAVHNLKVALDADVDWVTQTEYAGLVRCFTDVDEVISFPRHALLRNLGSLRRSLRRREYDLVVDLQGLLKSALVSRMARTRRIIGPSFRREGAGLLYSAVAGRRNKNRHAVEENLDVVRHLGLQILPPEFPVRFPEMSVTERRPRVALVPASRWPTKNWPAASFTAAARRLQERAKASVFIFGGKADAQVCGKIAGSLPQRVQNLAGKTSLAEMGGWFAQMDLVIANDTGPIHMAAAVGVPVLAIFGPTDAKRTGPYGPAHRVVAAELGCRPCFRAACPHGSAECLPLVKPDEVVEAALDMLKK